MPATQQCPKCGAEFYGDALEGLCERCLAQAAFGLVAEKEGQHLSSLLRFGDYELLQELGRGGMGVVYKARQVSLDRVVALKMMLASHFASKEFIQRFLKEAQAAAKLRHPNIVAIHEVGEHEGQHYFSMEYVEGRNLAELVRDNPLPARRAAAFLKTIAEAIHSAHEKDILHRDLKPSNVLIDGFDQPHITDFGLAKQIKCDATLTTTGQVLGSPAYMPPEQARGNHDDVGPQSDIYSLGAILYHLLAGRPPFLAETFEDTIRQLLDAEAVPLRTLNPNVPRDLETICLKCLEKSPVKRYSSAQALADDLNRFLGHEPILARPVSQSEKVWRWCRRKPALAAVVMLVITVAVGSTFAVVRLNRLRTEADRLRAEASRAHAEERLRSYVNAINVALREFPNGDKARANELLNLQIPKTAGEVDLRGFEWRYLWRLCHERHVRTLPRHNQVVGAMQFSPNGKVVATYCWDNTLRLWDLNTQYKLIELPGASALGGFSASGETFLTGTTNGSIFLCRVATGNFTCVMTNAGAVVACASNGKTFVAINLEGILKVRDVETLEVRFSSPQAVRRHLDYGSTVPVAISPDGQMLAVIEPSQGLHRRDQGVKRWDVATGAELPFLGENRKIHSLEFSPDGRLLAVGDGLGLVKVWNLDTQEFKSIQAGNLPILSLAFSPDGSILATGSSAQNIRLWEVANGRERPNVFHGQIGNVSSLAFSPDGKLLASGSRNSPVRIWSLDEAQPPDESHELLSADWGNFAFSPDSKTMAAGCKGNVVKVWNVDDFSTTSALRGARYVVAFSQDGKHLLTATEEQIPQLWDLETQTATPIPSYKGSMDAVASVDLSRDGRVAALGHKDGTLQLLEVYSGRELASWKAHGDEVHSVAFAPGGDKLISGGRDRFVMLWDVTTLMRSVNGRRNHSAKPLDTPPTLLGGNPEHKGFVCAVAVSHDGKMVASGCGAGTIKLWNPLELGKKSLASMSYNADVIRTLAFSPDDRTLACGSEDNTVKLWNIALGEELTSIQHDGPLRLVLFSPDGNTLATVTDHGTLRLFRGAPLQEVNTDLVSQAR